MSINVTVHGLTLQYESHSILDNLEFQISPGQRVALLGANGAGKSTLLRCISKAVKPAAGGVFLDHREIGSLNPRNIAQTMAVVPQESRADFDFSVEEVVLMGRLPHQRRFQREDDSEREIARQAMEHTGVRHLADRSVVTLSGGEKQRVIIARALCQEPKLLLLDEPTANLDLGYQHSLLELIKNLNETRGITVLAAIHDLNLAARFFDRMLLLDNGKILAAGTAENVLTPHIIKQAYGVEAFVYRHPFAGCIQISVRDDSVKTSAERPSVHVIGGGEEALPVLEFLRAGGFCFSVGPVTKEDSSYRFAVFNEQPVIEVAPFSPIPEHDHRAHLELMDKAALTVVPPIPFGVGNLRNLQAVETALLKGRKVAILDNVKIQRDFTGGKAEEIIKGLIKNGAHVVKDKQQLLGLLEEEEKNTEYIE